MVVYCADRGGHAPGHLRQAFEEYVETRASESEPLSLDDVIGVRGGTANLRWLIGQLCNGTDVLPAPYCEQPDIPQGSTHAQAVRHLKDEIG